VTEGGEGELYGVLRSLLLGSVSGVEYGSSAEGADLGAEGVEALGAAGGDYEMSALLGESEGCGAADFGAGSGDDGSFSGEQGGGGRGFSVHADLSWGLPMAL
jgi:hypothetical protein